MKSVSVLSAMVCMAVRDWNHLVKLATIQVHKQVSKILPSQPATSHPFVG